MDCQQSTGSFKIRGMECLVRTHLEAGNNQFIASSGGNAGYSLAYAARIHGGKVTVVVPSTTSPRMQKMIADQGAEVIVHGNAWNDADTLARQIADDQDAVYVSPFDDPLLWEGHTSLIDEVIYSLKLKKQPFPSKVVVAVGGGGLLCGVMAGLAKHGLLEQTQVIAAETEGAASFHAAVCADERVTISEITSVATSLGARQVAEQAWHWHLNRKKIISFVCSDDDAVQACMDFKQDYGDVVEPACGAALASFGPNGILETDALIVACGGISWEWKDFSDYSPSLKRT
ncbi:UNVERIFIED_CONTAM: hypothetical protein GTU68_061064 [Idotea baltica]|nr:hypothetical protein [Idotea baltica]